MEPPDFERYNPNFVTGSLPEGCKLCELGAKMVLLVTGLCSKSCFYCPLSEAKQHKDVVYANELQVSSIDEMIEEARSMDALGTGITGGDPLMVLERTVSYIQALKKEFGKEHQIHLYTCQEVGEDKIGQLRDAGLDELRVHLPPESWGPLAQYLTDKTSKIDEFIGYAYLIERAESMGMSFGIEIPVLPGKGEEIGELIIGLDSRDVEFINLNELESSSTNHDELRKRGYEIKGDTSAIIGSEEAAIEACELVKKRLGNSQRICVHYCSSYFKDAIQLRKRLGRRAKKVAKEYEVITFDSTLVLGIITPQAGEDFISFSAVVRDVLKGYDVPTELYCVDSEKKRIEIAAWVLEEIYEDIPGCCAIVEEYPSADRLEVERRPLGK